MLKRFDFLPADVLGLPPLAAAASRAALPPGTIVPRNVRELGPAPDALDPEQQRHLARWLETQLTQLGPHVHVVEAARRLSDPRARCVLTAIVPGLGLAPLAGLWNAVCCVRLAEDLERTDGAPVVPVVWLRTDERAGPDDARAWIPNRHHELQRIGLSGTSSGTAPDFEQALDEELHRLPAVRALLAQLYGDHPFVAEAIELLLPRRGESLARAATRALLELLGHRGLLVIEPAWLRDDSARALVEIVGRDPGAVLRPAREALARLGLDQGFDPAGAELVLWESSGLRRAYRIGGDGYRREGEPGSSTAAELAAAIQREPARFSPGPLLRPLVAERVLPLRAHLGDARELLGHALLSSLRPLVGASPVPFVLRPALTLIDEETERSLAGSGLALADALRGSAGGAQAAPPAPTVVSELRAIFEESARAMLERRPELARIEPSLGGQLRRAIERARGAIEELCQKAERVSADNSGRGRRHRRRLETVLRPKGLPQEEVLGPFTFFARYGWDWLDALTEEWSPFGLEHLVVHLSSERQAALDQRAPPGAPAP